MVAALSNESPLMKSGSVTITSAPLKPEWTACSSQGRAEAAKAGSNSVG